MLVDMRPVESSENITIMDEIDELLGTRRSYGWNSGSRPSMISAKYRLKEERRKVLKISVNKMKKIDDAESSLCRSVLINNTVKRLQAETRDDRTTGRTSPASPPSPTSTGYHGYHSPQLQAQPCGGGGTGGGNPQLVDITNLRESSPNGVGPGGVGTNGAVVGVCKTLANNNNNNINNNNNNTTTKPMMMDVQSSSLTAADQHHHHHHHHHHLNSLHNHSHHHHHHHNQHHQHHHLHQSHLHQNHHHHHNFHQTHQSSVSGCSLPVQYTYDDVEDEDDDTIASIMMQLPSSTAAGGQSSSPCGKRRRPSVDEPLDDLLSQFICNNNQREDEDVNVVDLDLHEYPAAKRLRTDEAAAAAAAVAAATAASVTSTTTSSSVTTADLCSSDCWSLMDTSCCDDTLDLYGGQVPAAVEHQDVLLPAAAAQSVAVTDCCPLPSSSSLTTLTSSASASASSSTHQDDHFGVSSTVAASGSTSPTSLSCGQASMFSEMQSAMFRNLIASLES
ncbi:SERTA domain [Cinara cedri]|uniref:SERTA domain n=1 Tax=Cinara cedri TaxID=506608 RepID=A0A5E4NDB7_9HEMI|nr:SERTA domain [Cinara cedri]